MNGDDVTLKKKNWPLLFQEYVTKVTWTSNPNFSGGKQSDT